MEQTRTCPHRDGANILWVNNDGKSAPVIFVQNLTQESVISLTNQIIRVSCPSCFKLIQGSARYYPEHSHPPQRS
jgi:hypothetical protein